MNLVNLNRSNTGTVDKSFVDISKGAGDIASPEEKEYSKELQEEAFGTSEDAVVDLKTAKQRAALEVAQENYQAILNASVLGVREKGESFKDQQNFFISTAPLTDAGSLEPSALAIKAADNSVAEAAIDNEDEIGSLEDSELLFTADDKAKYDLETEIINRTNKNLSDRGLFKMGLEIGQRFIPFVQSYKDWRVADEKTFHILPKEVREKQRAAFQYAKANMSVEEYGQFLNNEYERLVKEGHDGIAIQEYFEDMFTYNSRFDDVMQALDIFSLGKIVKGGNKVSRALKSGNKTKALKAVEEASTEDKIGHVIPTIAKPQEGPTESLSALVEQNDNIKISNTKALEIIQDTMTFEREVNPKAMDKYVKMAANEVLSRMPNAKKKVLDTNLYTIERAADGSHDMIVTFGGGLEGTTPFRKIAEAEDFVINNTNLLKGEYEIVRTGEGYFVKMRTTVPFTGRVMDSAAYKAENKPFRLKAWGRFFLGRAGVPDNFHEANNLAVRAVSRLRQAGNEMMQPIRNLKGADADAFDVLQAKQLNEQKWYTADELTDLGYSKAVIEANNAYRDINDIEYLIENVGVRKNMKDLGYKLIKSNPRDEGFIGKITENLDDFATSTFKDMETGDVYNIGEMSAEKLEEFKKAGRLFVRRHSQEIDIDDAIPVKYSIIKRTMSSVQDLPMFMVEYVGGGRRYYNKGTLFAKLPRTLSINGARTIVKPKTLFAGLDKSTITEKVNEINKALDEYAKFAFKEISNKELNQRLGTLAASAKHFRAASLKQLKQVLGDNIDPLLRVEIVEDGQELAQVRQLMAEKVASLVDDKLYFSSSMYDLIESNAQGYFRRGKPLKDVDGSFTATLSAADSAKKTLDKLINTYAFDEYNKMYAAEFRRLFGDVINPYDFANLSDMELLRGGRLIDLKEGIKNKALRNKIQAARHMQYKWQAITEQSTEFDKMVTTHMTNLAQKLGEKLPETFGRGTKKYAAISEAKPDKTLMGLTFHNYLGMFNPKQLITQAIGTVNVIALEPLHGLRAAALYPALRLAMSTDNINHIGVLAKTAARLAGVSVDDFKDMVTALKKIGAYNAEDVQLFLHSRSILDATRLKKASTFFFREGERFNMVTAQAASYLKFKNTLGHSPKTYEELKKVLSYGEELYLNMSRASVTPLQKGSVLPTQLLAQFTAYPIRFLEALFNKKFSTMQKTSLLLTNIALFGVGGTFGRGPVNYAIQKGKELFGMEEPIEEEFKIINGWLTDFCKENGIDINLSGYGPGLLDKPWQIVAEHGMQLPFISGLGSVWNTLVGISKFLYPTTTDVDLRNAMLYFSSERVLPTLRNATRGMLAMATGKLYTSNYELLKEDVSSFEAVLYGLGFKSDTEQLLSDNVQYIINKSETIEDIVKDLEKSYNKFIQTGSDDDWNEYSILSKACLQAVPESWRRTLLNRMKGIYGKYPKIPVIDKEKLTALKAGDYMLRKQIEERQ